MVACWFFQLLLPFLFFLFINAQDTLEKIAPTWMNVSLRMKDDPETDKASFWMGARNVSGFREIMLLLMLLS